VLSECISLAPAIVADDIDEIVPAERWVEILEYVSVDVSESAVLAVFVAVVERPQYPALEIRSWVAAATASSASGDGASRSIPSTSVSTPATLSAAVVDMRNSWTQRLIGLCAPSFGSGHATPVVPPQSRFGHAPRLRPLERARGVITAYVRLSIVTATIGDVTTAAMQPTHLLAAICRGDWVGWTRRMRVRGARRAKVSFFDDAGG
jgi:hypothetical protein